MVNTQLIAGQYPFVAHCNHTIQAQSYLGHTGTGQPTLDPATIRQYRCYIEEVERTSFTVQGATDGIPYVAYILSIPINGTDAVPIHRTDKITVVNPSYITFRRFGTIKSYTDQFGNLHNIQITFE